MKCCNYCDPNYEDILTDRTAQLQKYGDTYALVMYINGKEYAIAIEYCPKCGRKLTEEE
jgi:hypothetical protein